MLTIIELVEEKDETDWHLCQSDGFLAMPNVGDTVTQGENSYAVRKREFKVDDLEEVMTVVLTVEEVESS